MTCGGSIGGATEGLGATQRSLLVLIAQEPTISYRRMAEQLRINPSAVQKHLEKLKKLGLVERVGGTRGYWRFL